jgi:hypothetical protein
MGKSPGVKLKKMGVRIKPKRSNAPGAGGLPEVK